MPDNSTHAKRKPTFSVLLPAVFFDSTIFCVDGHLYDVPNMREVLVRIIINYLPLTFCPLSISFYFICLRKRTKESNKRDRNTELFCISLPDTGLLPIPEISIVGEYSSYIFGKFTRFASDFKPNIMFIRFTINLIYFLCVCL